MCTEQTGRWIFFTDIDDTLVNTDKTLSPENRQALESFLRAGSILVISTGRALGGAAALLKNLGFYGRENVLICSYNGALIYDTFREKTLLLHTVPLDLARASIRLAREHGIHIQAYPEDGTRVLAEKDNHHLQKYLSIQKLGLTLVPDLCGENLSTPKLLCLDYDDPKRLDDFRILFEQKMGGKLDCFHSNPNLLEIVPAGVSKGTALRYLADYFHVPTARTIAAGDAENDLSMIQAAGIGCAMQNSVELLKKHADYITEHDNNHAGVSELLHRFCL